MATFAYQARRAGSQAFSGVVDATSRAEAIARLRQTGCFPVSVEQIRGGQDAAGLRLGRGVRRISKDQIAVFTSQLASLLKAGLPLVKALTSLCDQIAGSPLADVVDEIAADVSETGMLSEAMAKYPRLFAPAYIAAVRAGEEGGMLAAVVGRLAVNLRNQMDIRARIRGALVYPIFLVVLGVATLAILLTFVIPRFTLLFMTMGQDLPIPTRLLIGFSAFMGRFWVILLIGLIGAGVTAAVAFKQEAVRRQLDRGLLVTPLIGSIISRSETARLARSLSELLKSGVPILTSLNIVRGVMTNRLFSEQLSHLREDVAKGRPIADGMSDLPNFSPLIVSMVAVGEQSGQLPELLMEVAELYEKECERAISAFTTVLGPSLIVILGGVIGFVITAILLPVFQASTLVG